jgi:hypothetical protein
MDVLGHFFADCCQVSAASVCQRAISTTRIRAGVTGMAKRHSPPGVWAATHRTRIDAAQRHRRHAVLAWPWAAGVFRESRTEWQVAEWQLVALFPERSVDARVRI